MYCPKWFWSNFSKRIVFAPTTSSKHRSAGFFHSFVYSRTNLLVASKGICLGNSQVLQLQQNKERLRRRWDRYSYLFITSRTYSRPRGVVWLPTTKLRCIDTTPLLGLKSGVVVTISSLNLEYTARLDWTKWWCLSPTTASVISWQKAVTRSIISVNGATCGIAGSWEYSRSYFESSALTFLANSGRLEDGRLWSTVLWIWRYRNTYYFSIRSTRSELIYLTKFGIPNRVWSWISFHGAVPSKNSSAFCSIWSLVTLWVRCASSGNRTQ